jgi:uncharacterized protein (TIGR02001 family)
LRRWPCRRRRLIVAGVPTVPRLASCALLWTLSTVPALRAEERERWPAPFGEFHAHFTIATDYAQSGISSTENQPAFQVGLDWHSAYLLQDGPPLRLYATVLGTNVSFPGTGPGEEIDLAAGFKLGLFGKRLTIDLGYIRYLYPSFAADFGLEYGEWSAKLDYDFGPLIASARVRYSPDMIGHAGRSWNKRGLITVPLDFLPLPDGVRLKAYGSLGNVWFEKPEALELPGSEYWYWQVGVVTSVWGLDLTLAYTDTNIEASGCGFTRACEGRFFASLTKVF